MTALCPCTDVFGIIVLHKHAGEFQEVVDVKLRHTHPRVQKQRAAAANLAAAVAASAASATSSLEETSEASEASSTSTAPDAAAASTSSSTTAPSSTVDVSAAAAAAAASSSSGRGIQVIQVLPWADADSSGPPGSSKGELLLELDNVSINTPDGGLALVQNLNLQV